MNSDNLTHTRALTEPTMSSLGNFSYAQNSGNDQWNDATPPLEWTVHRNDEEEVYLPYLSDVVLHLNELSYYCHITVLSSGPRGSVFLGNVVAINRDSQNTNSTSTMSLDVSSLLPSTPGATSAFNAVLDYMYTGNTDFPHSNLASIVMTAYVLRIQSLFDVSKEALVNALKGKDGVGAMGSAVEVLTDAQRIVASDDTAPLLAAIVRLAKETVNAGGSGKKYSGTSQSKIRRRRASYKAAMNSVHKKNIGVRARVKPAAPGHLKESTISDGQETKEKSSSVSEVQEHIVGLDHQPGKRIQSVHKGRRFSFTVPNGAQPGDVLKVVVPKPVFAQPLIEKKKAPPPPAPAPAPPSSDEEEEVEVEEEVVHMKEKKTEVEDPTNAMLWVYVDADGAQFGPFGRELMQGWYEGGMIPAKLCVRPSKREDLEFVAIDELFSNKQPFFGM